DKVTIVINPLVHKMRKHSPKRESFIPPREDQFAAELRAALKPGELTAVALNHGPVNGDKLLSWVGSFVHKTQDDLKTLYDRYELSPFKVLAAVTMVKTWSLTKEDYLSGDWLDPGAPPSTRTLIEERVTDFSFPKLRSFKQRDRDARLLEKA